MSERFKVGDVVWVPKFERREVKVPCPVCFGKKHVTLILGDDSECVLPCQTCADGFCPPTGYVSDYHFLKDVEQVKLTSIRIVESDKGEEVEYQADCTLYRNNKVFGNKEDALRRAEELAAEHEKEAAMRLEHIKKDKNKSYSWNAGYHMREAKRHEKDAAYHREKAVLCKQRIRTRKQ